MRKNSGNIIIVFLAGIAFVSICSVIAAAYFFFRYQQASPKTPANSLESPAPISSAVSGWKKLSSVYGYSIDYPDNWFVSLASVDRIGSLDQIESYDSSKITNPGKSGFENNQTKLELGKDSQVYDLSGVEERLSLEGAQYLSKEKMTLSGKPALKIVAESPAGRSTTVFVANDYPNVYFIAIYGNTSGDNKKIIDHMLSTFTFTTVGNSDAPISEIPPKRKTLPYKLPAGWVTVGSQDGRFEIGFDPKKNQLYGEEATRSGISFIGLWSTVNGQIRNLGYRYSFSIKPYDNGSRHNFLYRLLSFKPFGTNYDDLPENNFEREYLVQGLSCLVLFRIDISQWTPNWGVCPINKTEALSFSMDGEESLVEEILQTVKILK